MANAKIRGITIEIGGDTTKLGKALGESEKQTRNLQTELKTIEKLLQFDPTNTELLIQKQNVLADTILETSKKLDILKEAEAQVVAQFEAGEIGEDQLRAFQREIIQTEKNLNDMKDELQVATRNLEEFGDNNGVAKAETAKFEKATQEAKDALEAEKKALKDAEQAQKDHEKAVEDAKNELKDFGDKAKEAGEKVTKAFAVVGTATVAGAGYALKLSTEFDKAFNTLQTRTGATADEMVALNEAMEGVYKNNFGESIEDVAESMAIVKTNTKVSADEIQNLTERALLLRDTFDFDVNESTRSAKMLMDQFGISGEQAYNLIAQGAQNGLDKNGDLLDTINEYAVHYKQLGYTSEEFFNSLINGASSGTFSVDKLGDAMKEFGIRSKDNSASTRQAFEDLGYDADKLSAKFAEGGDTAREATEIILDDLFDLQDKVKQNEIGVALFGTMWEDLGIEGVKALMDVNGEASLTSDALEKMNDQKYDDIGSAIQGLGRTLQTDIVEPLGEELKPVVEDAISYVQEHAPEIKDVLATIVKSVGELIGWIVDNSSVVLSTITGIGAGLLAWNVATMIYGLVKAIKAFQLANEGATVAQALLNGVMKANPLILIISLIATLVTAIVTFLATNEEAREKVKEVWEAIKEAFGVVLDAIVEFFASAWEKIKEIWSTVSGFFSSVWEGIKNVFSSVGSFFSSVWNTIVNIFKPAVKWFTDLFKSIYNTLKSIIEVIIGIVKGCWEAIVAIFKVAYNWFKTNVLDPISKAFSTAWEAISGFAKKAWESIKNVFTPVVNWFKNTIITPVTNVFTGLWNSLKNGASGAWNGIKGVFSSVATFFKDTFTKAWTAVKNVFSTGGKIFDGIKDGIANAFKTIVNKIIGGINKVVSIPFNAINKALDKIRSASFLGVTPFSGLPSISVPQIPTLAKGGIVNRATLAEIGEDGQEAIVPLENNTEWLDKIARKIYEYKDQNMSAQDSAVLGMLNDIYKRMDKLNQSIVLDSGVLVGETINQIDQKLANNYTLKARGI